MALRIFDHLFVNHGWHAPRGIQAPEARVSTHKESPEIEIPAAEREEIERRSMIARLTYRGRLDPIMGRVARRLQADSTLSLLQLAAEFGVGEQHLSRALRSALGEGFKTQRQCPSTGPRMSGCAVCELHDRPWRVLRVAPSQPSSRRRHSLAALGSLFSAEPREAATTPAWGQTASGPVALIPEPIRG
jgi:AraC-like DNA-binding protein